MTSPEEKADRASGGERERSPAGNEPAAGPELIVIRDKRKVAKADATPPPTPAPEEEKDGHHQELVEAGPVEDVPAGERLREAPGVRSAGERLREAPEVRSAGERLREAPEVRSVVHEEKVAEPTELDQLRSALDERTADLQRITAEYANYRKRVDRDRTVASEQAVGMVLAALLPVLDDLDRAREHGDLTGPFASVAEQITTVTTKLGLSAFGEKGDAFDPNRHEAVAHLTSPDVTEATCIDVMRRGYLLGERLLRPAMVAVADPAEEDE